MQTDRPQEDERRTATANRSGHNADSRSDTRKIVLDNPGMMWYNQGTVETPDNRSKRTFPTGSELVQVLDTSQRETRVICLHWKSDTLKREASVLLVLLTAL